VALYAQIGEAEGSAASMEAFRRWLSTEGSPKSIIEKATFTKERRFLAGEAHFKDFAVRKEKKVAKG
jgi:hypothetical protein